MADNHSIRTKTVLSPIDHVFMGAGAYPVQFVFFYPRRLDGGRMRRALKNLKRSFWPLAGRLRKEDGRYCVQGDAAGELQLEEQECPGRLPDFDAPEQLAPYAIDVDQESSLTRLKLFQFPGGSILSVNIAHCLTDGYSFFYFLTAWAHNARSGALRRVFRNLAAAPKHHRASLWPQREGQGEIGKWPEPRLKEWLFEKTGLALSRPREGFSIGNSRWSILEFSRRELLSHLGNLGSPKEAGLSWHDLVAAQAWKTTAERWPVQAESLALSSAFDFRRVCSKVDGRYFGNAVRACGVARSSEQVRESSVLELAGAIRRSTEIMDETKIDEALAAMGAFWQAFQESGSQRLHVADPDNGLLVTNLSRLPSDRLDFGTGAPTRAIPMTPAPRTAIVTSSPNGFYVRLSEPI